jgi:hypothetical protein
VLAAYFGHCFGMDDAAEICHSDSDEVLFVDDETTGGVNPKESATMQKKRHNLQPVLKQTDCKARLPIPFWKIPTTGTL